MEIDEKDLKITHLFNVKLIDKSEKFYSLPFADGYVMSNFGRLYRQTIDKAGKEHWKRVNISKLNDYESYYIKLNGKSKKKKYINTIISLLLFGNENYLIYHRNKFDDPKRWAFKDLIILNNGGSPIKFINSIDFDTKSLNEKINSDYWNMVSRATNEKVKQAKPLYKDVTICDLWKNDYESFHDWYISNYYFFPGELSIDKDLLSLGVGDLYSPELACILPQKYNNIFKRSYSKLGFLIQKKEMTDGTPYYYLTGHAFKINGKAQKQFGSPKYSEVLKVARKRKAKYIRYLAKTERKAGFIPDRLIDAMEQWADLCESGISVWEPDLKELKKEGAI